MKLPPDQQRIKTLLTDTITLLCKNGLNYNSEFCVDALIGITVDQNQVFLVNIREKVGKDSKHIQKAKKRKASTENDGHLQNGEASITTVGGPSKEKLLRNSELNRHLQKEQIRSSPEQKKTKSMGSDKISGGALYQEKNDTKTLPSFNDEEQVSIQGQNHVNQSSPQAFSQDPVTNNNNYQKSVKNVHCNSPSVVKDNSKERKSADFKIKREPTVETEESNYTMQLLYSGHDEQESSNSEIPNLATGPPVWPEPMISFTSGLTLPTVIAPDTAEQSPVNTEAAAGQSQSEKRSRRRKNTPSRVKKDLKQSHPAGDMFEDSMEILNQSAYSPNFNDLDFSRNSFSSSPSGSAWRRKGQEMLCDICSKVFRSKEGWKIHMERHEGKSRYKCPHCDRGFMAQTHLKAHISEHTKELPWKCDDCGIGFKYLFTLKKHRTDNHSCSQIKAEVHL